MIFSSFDYFRRVKGKLVKYSISFLLFTLMLFKVSSFHTYAHHDDSANDIENCSICDLAIENQNTEFQFTATEIEHQRITSSTTDSIITSYIPFYKTAPSNYGIFGRPPPALV